MSVSTAPSSIQIDRRHAVGLVLLATLIIAGLTWALVAVAIDRSSNPTAPATHADQSVVAPPTPTPAAVWATQARELSEIAAWANREGLAGQSPASLAPIASRATEARQLSEIAAWANHEGLGGQSLASLQPVSNRAGDARQLSELAAWANREGLAGQSPASLQPING